ncbi:hypothetical protein J2M53_00735 [Arthrobacter sp. zg-ZUI100]|uniref:hypothetical protein n=1 Tax=Arthrobacter jiangjiafuii TaxID=2817475 RepID=UPI001AEE24FD|nr:hypothetical protein [Arthrobacter jiangjiafuii]MBP3034780.1 hypothetical protein [Arthrobacter jiangjiafuii]
MITRRQAALALDIPLEMATRHGIPARLSEEELEDLQANPPKWLAQSRANRTGKRPVWVELECTVCGYRETARPRKWWPEFAFLACADHASSELPPLEAGRVRGEYDGIGTRFIGYVDVPVSEAPAPGTGQDN